MLFIEVFSTMEINAKTFPHLREPPQDVPLIQTRSNKYEPWVLVMFSLHSQINYPASIHPFNLLFIQLYIQQSIHSFSFVYPSTINPSIYSLAIIFPSNHYFSFIIIHTSIHQPILNMQNMNLDLEHKL